MKSPDPIELFPVVDENGNTIGEAPRNICHDGISRLLHPVVHVHLFNSQGELFLQKRSLKKDIQPGKWDTSVGGHIGIGETVDEALQREAYEELGLKNFKFRFLGRYVWESSQERELVTSFSTISDGIPVINLEEIDDGRFWSLRDIRNNLGREIFTPNFETEFCKLLSLF
jgi:isopentenyldiphosphate isomerase